MTGNKGDDVKISYTGIINPITSDKHKFYNTRKYVYKQANNNSTQIKEVTQEK
jgi:hypothetical protein